MKREIKHAFCAIFIFQTRSRIEAQILLRRQHYGWQKNPGIPGIPGIQKIQSDTISRVSGINVGTIRKYELGIRNPKPDQLEKIATALRLNVSVFWILILKQSEMYSLCCFLLMTR